jgi:hypothetical protein
MVAYSFQVRFCEPILDGTKGGTIRGERLRGHARPGDALQLYTGMRTRHCRLITRKTCCDLSRLLLNFERDQVHISAGCARDTSSRPVDFHTASQLDIFARFDGFNEWGELKTFWRETHDVERGVRPWYIRWLPLPEELLA